MVVAYKWGTLSHAIISRMVKTDHIALPNILAGERLVPEFLQEQATPENLARAVLQQLDDLALRKFLRERFDQIHQTLRKNASDEAAAAVLSLLPGHRD
jgi:lipid-A-disaccharide synthase